MSSNKEESKHQSLTDTDIDKIVNGLEKKLEQRFYINLGKGIWAFVWRAAIAALLALAAYGHYKGP